MSYGRNFGMRSFENIVRDGRFRVPKTGTPLMIGAPVQIDPATPGYLKVADAGADPSPGCGLAVYEHIQFQGVDTNLVTNHDHPFNKVPLGRYAQMMHGEGTKVWFKNTEAKTLYDGTVRAAEFMVAAAADGAAAATVATTMVGQYLTPAANGKLVATTTAADGWLFIEQVNPNNGLIEARFTF